MPFIRETIVTTINEDGSVKISPLGVHIVGKELHIKPFKPSITLDNIIRHKSGVINYVDDVRVFSGCITKRKMDWGTVEVGSVKNHRLDIACAHTEFSVIDTIKDEQRPTLICKPINEVAHRIFYGYNRAQSAVIELCILVSRLHILDIKKIQDELQYLSIAIEKTAGDKELEAWDWLIEKIDKYIEENKNDKNTG